MTGETQPAPFALQAAMRDSLRAALRRGAVAVIDIGSSKIACAILRVDFNNLPKDERAALGGGGREAVRVTGVGLNRSRGVKRGAIVDMQEAEQAIRAAVNQAERDAGESVHHAVVTLTGAYPRSHSLSAEIAVEGPQVTAADVTRAIAACRPRAEGLGFGEGREVLHATPVNWTIDSQQGVRDPKSFSGRRLGVDMHVLTVADMALPTLAHCLARADLELAGVVSTPYASGLGALLEEELEDGAACLDMGGGATSVSMFVRRQMIFADMVSIGGEDVTLAISRELGLPLVEAERLKTLEGSAILVEGAGREPLPLGVESGAMPDGARPTRADLCGAIRPRIEEILELSRDRLEQAGFAYLPNRKLLLTGGAAQLPGMVETAQRVFGRDVRVGAPIRLSGLPPTYMGPAFSAVAGLASYILRPGGEVWDRGSVNTSKQQQGWSGWFKWIRETW